MGQLVGGGPVLHVLGQRTPLIHEEVGGRLTAAKHVRPWRRLRCPCTGHHQDLRAGHGESTIDCCDRPCGILDPCAHARLVRRRRAVQHRHPELRAGHIEQSFPEPSEGHGRRPVVGPATHPIGGPAVPGFDRLPGGGYRDALRQIEGDVDVLAGTHLRRSPEPETHLGEEVPAHALRAVAGMVVTALGAVEVHGVFDATVLRHALQGHLGPVGGDGLAHARGNHGAFDEGARCVVGLHHEDVRRLSGEACADGHRPQRRIETHHIAVDLVRRHRRLRRRHPAQDRHQNSHGNHSPKAAGTGMPDAINLVVDDARRRRFPPIQAGRRSSS